jgi:hypothetical protein
VLSTFITRRVTSTTCGTNPLPDSDGWNYAYRIYQNLRSSSEEYKVEVEFDVLPEAGQRYQEIGLFVGYDDAESNRQWPFHKFGCISDHLGTYVNHHAVRENSYTEGWGAVSRVNPYFVRGEKSPGVRTASDSSMTGTRTHLLSTRFTQEGPRFDSFKIRLFRMLE